MTEDPLTAFLLTGRVAVVTGAGRGIGREIALLLAAAGADIAVADIDDQLAGSTVEEVQRSGRRAVAVPTDVADPEAAETMAALVLEAFGRVDVLVNNAGIAINRPALEMTADEWHRVMRINSDGVYWCSRSIGRHLVAQRSGSIVNIASMSGLVVNWPQPQAAYNASKAAVIQLTRSLASEWAAHGVRVNAVSPGYIGTEMTRFGMGTPGWGETGLERTPMGRLGEPIDVARAVLFLASDAACFITGANLVVDGGYTIW